MYNFVTLFNINFINQGALLYDSLRQHYDDFKLYVFCFDNDTFDILRKLNHENLIPIKLDDLERKYEELNRVKNSRKLGEYCWTSTPFVIKYCLEVLKVQSVVYLDSDLYFLRSPGEILNLLPNDKNVIITGHNYSKNLEHLSKNSGTYCVQFMYFNQENSSISLLNKWADQCLEWCHDYYDEVNDRFGDQKYLDGWETYSNVYIPSNASFAAGPWNIDRIVSNGNFNDIIFYHFHDFKIKNDFIDIKRLLVYSKNDIFFVNLYLEYISKILLVNKKLSKEFKIKKIKCYFFLLKIILKNGIFIVKMKSIVMRVLSFLKLT